MPETTPISANSHHNVVRSETFARAQRAIDDQLLSALAHPHLNLRHEQQYTAGRDQHYHDFQCLADLGQNLSNLTQDTADIQQTQRGKCAVKLRQ